VRVIELRVENFKNIALVEFSPPGGTVIVSGANGAGKSALIDSYWMALDRKHAAKSYPDPIKHGEENAKVVVDLGKYIVTRTWTKTNTYLKIENTEGAVFKSPDAMLNSLIGELSFDPQEFAQQSEKEQLEILLSLLDLPIDLTAIDEKRKNTYAKRTEINRGVKDLEGQLKGIEIPPDVPDEELNTADIMTDFHVATDQVAANKDVRNKLTAANEQKVNLCSHQSQLNDQILRLGEQIAQIETQVTQCANQIDVASSDIATLTDEVNTLEDPDLEVFQVRLAEVEETNVLVRKKQERAEVAKQLTVAKTNSTLLTQDIQSIDSEKAEAIENATMPVPLLSFNESGVTYNGVPLKQCSAAEQLRVSVAMAMALNPEIRVIRITDGSLLDSSNLALIEEMAEEEDFQVWIERVDESGKLGVYIKEGEVVAENPVLDESQQAVDYLERQQDEIDEGIHDEEAPPGTHDNEEEERKSEMPSMPEPTTNKP